MAPKRKAPKKIKKPVQKSKPVRKKGKSGGSDPSPAPTHTVTVSMPIPFEGMSGVGPPSESQNTGTPGSVSLSGSSTSFSRGSGAAAVGSAGSFVPPSPALGGVEARGTAGPPSVPSPINDGFLSNATGTVGPPAAGTAIQSTGLTPPTDPNVAERPIDVRDAARLLAREIKNEIDRLNASKPNEPGPAAQQNSFVAFLLSISDGLEKLAGAIDEAIKAGAPEKPDPARLAKVSKAAHEIVGTIGEGLERNRAFIVDHTIRVGLFGAGFTFLHTIGIDAAAATGIVSALMGIKMLKGKG